MNRYLQTFAVVLLFALSIGAQGQKTTATVEKEWPDPGRYEKTISGYEKITTAPKGALVAYGSSSIGGWHPTIKEDLAPVVVVPRGFGGSNMNDALHFMDRVILPLEPAAVLLYEGDNDVQNGQPVDAIIGKYREFLLRLNSELPETHTYIISVKPSISRWEKWPVMAEVNKELQEMANANPLVTYIDVATPMLGEDGKPLPDIFKKDNLHLNRKGYDIWRDAVRPVILKNDRLATSTQ